jgi:hypothetical protein
MKTEMPTAPAERTLSGLQELSVDALRWTCDPARPPFETSNQVAPVVDATGQDRAIRA